MRDLLNFIDIQAKTQTQAPKQNVSGSNNNNSENKPKVFDSIMNEYSNSDSKNDSKNLNSENVQPESNGENLTAFKGGKLFSGSVIEILADEVNVPENLEIPEELLNVDGEIKNLVDKLKISLGKVKDSQPEVLYSDEELNLNEEISQLLNLSDEELNEKLAALPEDLRTEIKNLITEINNALENGGDINAIKSSVEKLSDIINKPENKIKPEAKKISDDDLDDSEIKTDEGQEPELISIEAAGAAAINDGNKIVENNAGEKSEKIFDVKDSNQRQNSKIQVQNQNQRVSNETENQAQEVPANENSKTESKFSEQLNNLEENANENEAENQNQNSNFNQARENFSDSRNQSRSRNENNRRVSNENSSDNERNSNATHRTESRNDFQSFFEGVLNTRRTSSTNSSEPLNLRGNLNLNQSETLRDGLTNVVRFIRADGVQKASVVIDPPALGRISVELTSSSSGVEASIKVASEQIRQLVQDQLTQLRMNLSEQGVQVAEFTVDVQQDNQQGGNSQNENQQDNRGNFIAGAEDEDDTEEFRIDLEEGLLYWVA